jgi:putative oxidoreductase
MIARILTGKELNLILRLLLAGMFLFAAWDKVVHPQSFAISVRAYKIIPLSYSNMFAVCVAWGEVIAASMLLLGVFTKKAAGAIFLLLGMFFVAIATVLVRGMVVDCGCFGEGGSSTGPLLLVRNVALMAGAFLIMRYNDGFLSLFPGSQSSGSRTTS